MQNFLLHGNLANYGRLNTSDGQRLDAQNHALSVIKSHPLGLGLGTAGPASFHSKQPVISENYYLQIAIELGIPGLVLFLCLLTSLGRALYQYCNRPLAASALASLIGISIVNLFLHGWADSSTAIVWAIAAGASLRHHD